MAVEVKNLRNERFEEQRDETTGELLHVRMSCSSQGSRKKEKTMKANVHFYFEQRTAYH
jgi:hypothetical protein